MNRYDFDNYKNMSCDSFIKYLLTLSSNELSLLGCALGFLLSIDINANQQSSLGNFFELIGQVLLTISAQNINLQPQYPTRQELQAQIDELKRQINNLRRN